MSLNNNRVFIRLDLKNKGSRFFLFVLTCVVVLFSKSMYGQRVTGYLTLKGKVSNKLTGEQVALATVVLQGESVQYQTTTNESGEYIFKKVSAGNYRISFSSLNFKTEQMPIVLGADQVFNTNLQPLRRMLNEVYVTASEAKGKSSTSIIDKKAMQLLQPSSFTDLLELLPGGRSVDPKLMGMNQIRLREPANAPTEKFDMSSLGVAFYMDGALINTTANIQTTEGLMEQGPNLNRNTTNKGLDMRTLSTDQIESVEIVRGIASVEYGDLTSGLVKIQRKKGATPYTARIKTDGFSKLFSVGKGVSILEKSLFINTDVGYLNAKSSPTDNFTNYKRINASVRTEKFWENEQRKLIWNTALDYATSIDNQRTDPDNSYQLTDSYKSTFKSYGLTTGLKWEFKKAPLFRTLEVIGKLSYQHDFIDISQWVQARSATILANSLVEGEYDAGYITPSYVGLLQVGGKPLNAFVKAQSTTGFKTGVVKHAVKAGIEVNYSKNYGMGQVYDLNYPVSTTTTSDRPRAFNDIPAMQNISLFAEDELSMVKGEHRFALTAGIRGMASLGMDKRYLIANKPYLDPRVNVRWTLPAVQIGSDRLVIDFGGGYGIHTKLPTMDQLYPGNQYNDLVQLNFYHNDLQFRRANVMTYVTNPVNYNLGAAVNKKWELNTDISFAGNRLSVTYFRERMTSGFYEVTNYRALAYRKYDNTSIDASNLTQKPALSDFKYEDAREFHGYATTVNGATFLKEGIEYQLSSKRISAINTRFTLNGAWLKTKYLNSLPVYRVINEVTDNKIRQFLGRYNEDRGYLKGQLNTNLTIDSYLPSLGMTLAVSVQSLLWTSSQSAYESGMPFEYVDINGNVGPYTEASKTDPNLQGLYKPLSATGFRKYTTPLDIQANLKASKQFKNKATASMFVNRILTYTPSYTSYGVQVVRRGASPYFGMELTFNL